MSAFKTYDVKVNMPVSNTIAVKVDKGYRIYFESLGKVYKKLNQEEPKFIANGYLLSVDGNGNIYLYRNINIKTTKIYRIDKNGNEKEMITFNEKTLLVRRCGDVVIFITAKDKDFKEYDMDLINLKTAKKTVIQNASPNLVYGLPLFSDRGNIALVFYKDKKSQMVENGKIAELKNFESHELPGTRMELGLNVYENLPIGFNKIVQLRKGGNSIKLLLVDVTTKF
ncbi:hypothetical protein [Thermoanaerobacter wiegelii]|uniref:Uncharacterized protein n=1 Tax=Thermoanaerobacter wiegelii Rt8.B1 TaxID=697303 RepID=G2MRJ0_9THEO|nr:hypothetical protein [Thermoanaerobacter wiegelii]AEM79352.1 hypothetical protein Thewi_1979 [Thermoanaerobacter wiegelii Rt8.B1]